MELDADYCVHIEALKRYLDKNGLWITGADEQVYLECERCELDVKVTELYAEEMAEAMEAEPEEDD